MLAALLLSTVYCLLATSPASANPYSGDITFQNAAVGAANGTTMDVAGLSGVGILISGTFTGLTVNFEANNDNTATFYAVSCVASNGLSVSNTATATGLYFCPNTGIQQLRSRITANSPTGSITVTGKGQQGVVPAAMAAALANAATNVTQLNGNTVRQDVTGELDVLACDKSTAGQCQTVDSSGRASVAVDGVANTKTVSGALNVLPCDNTTSAQCAAVRVASGALAENSAYWLAVAAAGYGLDPSASAASKQVPLQVNQTVTAVASGTYTSTQTQADQTNYNYRGVQCVLTTTAMVGAGTFTFEIDAKDSVGGAYFALVTSGNISSASSTTVLTVYPGINPVANSAASTILPRTWRAKATYISGTSETFSVGCSPEI